MNEVNENVMDNVGEVMENCEVSNNETGKTVGKICIFAGIAAGVAAILYKCRNKIRDAFIKGLEKKGYTIIKPGETVEELGSLDDEESSK